MTTTYPTVTPDLEGSRYCVPCVWNGRHPDRTDDRIYIVRRSDRPLDTTAYCHAHALSEGAITEGK